ncbi:MAG: glucose-6-phosphate dehydrogenase assembly protein OpcA [bacterium]|nr:glucose-6-phosphate dehydrogenase assembly protein OpcA [bacterium]
MTVNPATLMRDLDAQWAALGELEDAGVLRACSMTLVVLTDKREGDSQSLGETLAALMRDHPSRAIVVRLDGSRADAGIEGRVSVQCWMPFGRRQQICSEQIEISASSAHIADLPPVLRGLAVPDLPLVIWRRGQLDPALDAVLDLADKVIVDSTGTREAAAQLARIRSATTRKRPVADLSWTRLTRWRQTIAQAFATAPPDDIEEVSVSHYPEFVPLRALYLAAWLRGAIGEGPRYWFRQAGRQQPCQPRGEVEGVSLAGPNLELSIFQLEGEAVKLTLDGAPARKVFPLLTDYTLLREELTITGHDPVYDAVLEQAGRIVV